jgi:LysM domain
MKATQIDDREEAGVAFSGVHRSRADREERLFVALSAVPDWGRRVRALLAAGVLAVSVGATGTSVASEPDDQQEGVVVPESGSPSPGDVDQGSGPETTLPYEVDPVLTDPQADAPQDDPSATPGDGSAGQSDEPGPIEAAPVDDPDADLQLTDPAVPDGLDSGVLPVSPTPPAPPTSTPVAPENPAPQGPPHAISPDAGDQATWRAIDRSPRALRGRLSSKRRRVAEVPVDRSEPIPTQTTTLASEPVTAMAAPLGRGRFHVVRPGESLWSIASRLLGPGASDASVALEVRRLWRLNSKRIGTGDPNLLRAGVKLRLR